ncbi:MAG: hypothetical protein IKT98_08570 [Selenomonadaceae bacterium]|nr:hypothetical protein [Selenomonadaceae bacterium]
MATTLINTNMSAVRSHNMLEKNNASMDKAMNRVNTTLKINSVQDAPSKWAVSERMRERINALNQADQNVQNDTNMMKTAEKGINDTVTMLRTIRASVLQAFDASTNDKDRYAIAKEIKSLFDQIDETAYNTRYNGKVLIADLEKTTNPTGLDYGEAHSDGTAVKLTFQIGADARSKIDVDMQNMTLKGLGLAAYTADLAKATAGIPTNSTSVILLRKADAAGSESGASGSAFLTALDAALDKALDAATDVGALEKRLGYTADNVATQIENLEASDSAIRDADMAKEISNYMKWSVASQASQYMLAQSNQNAFQVLSLLQ